MYTYTVSVPYTIAPYHTVHVYTTSTFNKNILHTVTFCTNLLYNCKLFTGNKREFIWATTFKIKESLHLPHNAVTHSTYSDELLIL